MSDLPGAAVVVAAADPGNPLGSAIPWPEHSGRPSRVAGAYVVFVGGRPTAFVERGGRSLLGFTSGADELAAAAAALTDLASRRLRRMVVGTVDGQSPDATTLGQALLAGGFTRSYRGLAAPIR
jgi:ATP-dependent Lhr-like helicase